MLDALLRLMRLLDTPRDIEMLAPLFVREILYRLLRGPQGHLLHDLAMTDSQTHRVTRAIEWLNRNYDKSLRIEDLAREVNLSVSTLHHRFKEVTALSPLQYQKQLRLQEARRLLLSEGLEVAVAGHRVGYESPSQFSREYSRLFGAPPLRDLASCAGRWTARPCRPEPIQGHFRRMGGAQRYPCCRRTELMGIAPRHSTKALAGGISARKAPAASHPDRRRR